MNTVMNQTKSIVITVFFQMLFLFLFTLVAPSSVYADGEEPFVGVINSLTGNRMTIKVTDIDTSSRVLREEIVVLITRNTTIRNVSLEVVSLRQLSVGTAVRIQPKTLPNNDVEASIVIVDNRR